MVTRAQLLEEAAPALHEGEQVLDLSTGYAHVNRMGIKTTRPATILVTDRRVVIISKKAGGNEVQDYAYGLLTGVDFKTGFTGGRIYIRASGDSSSVGGMDKSEIERIAQAIRHKMAAAHPVGVATAELAPAPDFAEEMRKLAALRDDGLLTEGEFQARRSRLLES